MTTQTTTTLTTRPRTRMLRWRSPRSLARVTLTACLLALGIMAPQAFALPADGNGNYTQILCASPTSEEGLGISGMPEGLSNPASIDTWQITSSEVNCAAGRMLPDRGVPMAVGQTNTYAQGTWSALLYQAPANVTINGGAIYRAEKAEGTNNGFMGIDQQGGEYDALYSLPRNNEDSGDWFAGNVASRGTFAWPFSPENLVNLTVSPDGGHWDVNATCDPNGNNNSSCTLSSGQWEYRIFGGEISLTAGSDPQASSISGPLASETPLRASESVTFSATDQGPGLAYVKLLVDGETVQSQIIDTNNGHCVPVPGRDAYTWAYQLPCKTSVGGRSYSLNTALLADGSHHVQVIIEDAAGNQSIVLDRTVNTDNAPANATTPTITPGEPAAGTTLSASPGAWSAPAGAGSISYGYQWQDCNSDGENCQAIPGAQTPSYTPTPGEVGHTLRVLVNATDTDGLATAASPTTSTIAAGPAAIGVLSDPPTSQPPAGAGAQNGTPASESALLQLAGPATLSRSYAHRAFTLTGHLANSQGQPIADAILEILQQTTTSSTLQLVKHAQTTATGAFTVAIPAGPSRLIEVAYRAYANDTTYAAQAKMHELVAAGVQLHINTHTTSPTGTIIFSGQVAGPIPHQGTLIELLVHYHGHWEPIRTPNSHGTFHITYQFEHATGHFPFRIEIPAGQAGYPYTNGYSNTVNITAG